MMVVDATGTVVGTWMGDAVLMKIDGEFFIVDLSGAGGFRTGNIDHLYQSADCTGQDYIMSRDGPAWVNKGIFVPEDGDPEFGGKGTIVVPTGLEVLLPIFSALTYGEFGRTCKAEDGYVENVFSAKSISVDFQTPFSLK
jgi:hypothetical protein